MRQVFKYQATSTDTYCAYWYTENHNTVIKKQINEPDGVNVWVGYNIGAYYLKWNDINWNLETK